jgi:peptide/nickel transport system permease protein
MEAPTDAALVPGALEPVVIPPPPRAGRLGKLAGRAGVWVPAILLAAIFFLCFIWPLIGPVPSPTGGTILDSDLPSFSAGHLLGTDQTGNDEWSRLLYGGRASLEISLAVNGLGILVGGLVGAYAAMVGGWRDSVLMRMLDILIAIPSLVLAIAIAEVLGPGEIHVIEALAFFSIPAFGRIARAATLRVRELNFMAAAELSGTGRTRILVRHIVPNIWPELVTFGLLGMGVTIVLEGALSFLGLGIQQPTPSWGNMIYAGQSIMSATPKFVLLPSAALFITVIAFNLLGEGLRARWSA